MTVSDPASEKMASDLQLEEVKRLREKEKIVDVEEDQVKILVFSLAGNLYAFHGDDVREILPMTDITWVPGTPEFIAGLTNVRGDIESVVDLRFFLDLGKTPSQGGLIALAEKGGIRSGILVDTVEDVADIPASAIKPAIFTLDRVSRDLVAGEIEHKGKVVVLLDLARLFPKIVL